MSNGTIEELVAALDLQTYELNLRIGANLSALVVKSIHFIEPLVALSIENASPQKCFCIEPTCPYGSLASLELKANIINNGEKSVNMEEMDGGFKREILFKSDRGEISIEYVCLGMLKLDSYEEADKGIERLMRQSVVDGLKVRKAQLAHMLEARETIKQCYNTEIKNASEGVITLIGMCHDASREFQETNAFFNENTARYIASIRNFLTLGNMRRSAQKTLGNIAAGYLAWAVLKEKLEQGAESLDEDAIYVDCPELAEIAQTFRGFVTNATYSKNRVWRLYQNEKKEFAQFGFYPKVSDEAIIQAEQILTTPEKKIVYES